MRSTTSALSMATPRLSRFITNPPCPMATHPSPTTPQIFPSPIITRMRRISFGLLLLLFSGCRPNQEVRALLQPSQALAEVLAQEAVRLAGANRSITLITHDASWGPPSTAEQALRTALKKQNATLDFVKTASLGNPMLSGEVGLKAADFFEAMEKSAKAGAVISLV